MRGRWLLVGAASMAAVLVSGAAAVYAYDESRADVIADGVTVQGIHVGGLTAPEARALLRTRLVPRFRKPVTAVYRGRRFVLSPSHAQLRVDVQASVEAAFERTRSGSALSRVLRDVRGERLDAHLGVRLRYSGRAVAAFAKRVKQRVDRDPRSAKLIPSARALRTVPSRPGVAVRRWRLAAKLVHSLRRPEARKRIAVPTELVKPKLTTRELAARYPAFITIDRTAKRLRVFRRLKLHKVYKIAVGQIGYDTPSGLYRIQNKAVNPSWHVPDSPWTGSLAGRIIPPGPENPIKARWLGIYDGAGIHGTDAISSLGTAASHGCIRMSIPDVIELYDLVPVRAPVYIG